MMTQLQHLHTFTPISTIQTTTNTSKNLRQSKMKNLPRKIPNRPMKKQNRRPRKILQAKRLQRLRRIRRISLRILPAKTGILRLTQQFIPLHRPLKTMSSQQPLPYMKIQRQLRSLRSRFRRSTAGSLLTTSIKDRILRPMTGTGTMKTPFILHLIGDRGGRKIRITILIPKPHIQTDSAAAA